ADQPLRGGRSDDRVPTVYVVDRCHDLFTGCVLEQEGARAGTQRPEGVLVQIEGRQHQHFRRIRQVLDPAGGGHPVQHRHAHVPPPTSTARVASTSSASCPSPASATSSRSGWEPSTIASPRRISSWSSTIITLMMTGSFLPAAEWPAPGSPRRPG